jgi:uncharacterized protein (TIGR03437 family)
VAPTQAAETTAAKVTIISGAGQLICPGCPQKLATQFKPLVVRVTDINGTPIAGKAVTWAVISQGFSLPSISSGPVTDSNGFAYAIPFQYQTQQGSSIQPFAQSVISATADNATALFTETMALSDIGTGTIFFSANLVSPGDATLTGNAGSIGQVPLRIHVSSGFVAYPGVSVRILSPEVTSDTGKISLSPYAPSASCRTGDGADPGAVLTDVNGDALCYPVFGPVAGTGFVSALVGGLDPLQFDQSITPVALLAPISFAEINDIQLNVAAVTPGLMTRAGGDGQTLNPGQVSAALVVRVTDIAGAVPIGNQNVNWTVSPVGAATVNPSVSTTDAQGQTQTVVTLSANAAGQVSVKASLTGSNSNISTTFTIFAHVQVLRLDKVPGGDLQSSPAGQKFPSDLAVQVIGSTLQPIPSQAVAFVVTGGSATLSVASPLSDATGIAHVTVTAGSTPGTVTVNAFVGNLTQTFTLTIIPPGPSLTTSSFYIPGGTSRATALSPCGLFTVVAAGLAPNLQGLVYNTSSFGPWATTLGTATVTVNGVAAPIYNVGTVAGVQQLTFQVPCETAPAAVVPISINVGGGSATIGMPVQPAGPGILETVMSDGVRRAVAIRPDGTFVSLQNPARTNETVRVFVTGMGPTAPALVTGALPYTGTDSMVLSQIIVGVNNGGAGPNTARVSPNLIGVYEVSLVVPSNTPSGNDIVLSVAVNVSGDVGTDGKQVTRFSNGSKLPIAQ